MNTSWKVVSRTRRALTLIEIILALVILTVVATVTLTYVTQPVDRTKQQAYEVRVQQLELLVKQYQADYGTMPSANLRELASQRYLGETLPLCPVDGQRFILDRQSGQIMPHSH